MQPTKSAETPIYALKEKHRVVSVLLLLKPFTCWTQTIFRFFSQCCWSCWESSSVRGLRFRLSAWSGAAGHKTATSMSSQLNLQFTRIPQSPTERSSRCGKRGRTVPAIEIRRVITLKYRQQAATAESNSSHKLNARKALSSWRKVNCNCDWAGARVYFWAGDAATDSCGLKTEPIGTELQHSKRD